MALVHVYWYLFTHSGPIATSAYDVVSQFKSSPDLDRPDIQGVFVPLALDRSSPDLKLAEHPGVLLEAYQMRPTTPSSVHLGGRLPDEVTFTEQTYAADQRAMTLATRDVVRGALSDGGIRRLTATIGHAASRDLDTAEFRRRVAAALTKDEARRATESFAGPDVVNLPAGQTAWRASNALSWLARATDDSERRLDLERLAGSFLRPANGEGNGAVDNRQCCRFNGQRNVAAARHLVRVSQKAEAGHV